VFPGTGVYVVGLGVAVCVCGVEIDWRRTSITSRFVLIVSIA